MEELYNNLDNYNEVSALEELKSENTQLKIKLQDYTTKMEKLQQDFDTLSSDFKKLENNYSSLLKTAKLEIERKTQIINNINTEKDMLVIKALQNGNKSVWRLKNTVPEKSKNKWDNNKALNKKNRKNATEMQDEQNNKSNLHNVIPRLEDHHSSSNNKLNTSFREDFDKEQSTAVKKSNIKAVSSNYVNNHTKENVQDINIVPKSKHEGFDKAVPSKTVDVRKRRKSISATEVECDRWKVDDKPATCSTDGVQQHEQRRYKEERKLTYKYDNDRHRSKSSETSSRDERHWGHLELARDSYKDRPHKHYDSDRFRNRDKYDNSTHKRYSPENYRRYSRDHYSDNNYRTEFRRGRGRESPLHDRNHYGDVYERYNEQENYPHANQRHSGKHKASYEFDHPHRKRQKINYYGQEKEDVRWQRENIVHEELTETFEMLQKQYISCQSPDYVSSEIAYEPVKVIMDKAVTPLDDPRLKTSKYILSNDNGFESLTTTIGKHDTTHLESIDKNKWQIQTVAMPRALSQPPTEPEVCEQVLEDLNTVIDDPNSQLTTESKEAGVDRNISSKHATNADKIVESHEVLIVKNSSNMCQKSMVDKNTSNKFQEDIIENTGSKKEDSQKATQGSLTGYKIPKKKSEQQNENNTLMKEKSLEVTGDLLIFDDNQIEHTDITRLSSGDLDKHDTRNFIESNKRSDIEDTNKHDSKRVLSSREIVEGDLELSDETCDNTELQKMVSHSLTPVEVFSFHKSRKVFHNADKDITILSNGENCFLEQDDNDLSKGEFSHRDNILLGGIEKKSPSDKSEGHNDISKKQKNKKKRHKEPDHTECIKKKLKSKKGKPKEVESKFKELFGDSNSLITPGDLGISSPKAPSSSPVTDIYVPIFEDAQDATDIKQITHISADLLQSNTLDKEYINKQKDTQNDITETNNIVEISEGFPEVLNYDAKLSDESEKAINTVHDSLKLENTNKANAVVTTIIISTGVQPDEFNTESRAESLVNAEELLSDDTGQDQITTHKTHEEFIKALATSTPHKQVMKELPHEIDPKLPDSTLSSNTMTSVTDNPKSCIPNTTTTLDPPNEDLPDVRIFVKRRRRIVKTAK